MIAASLSPAVRQYLLVTANYWAFTLTDGALRMLVVLHFYSLGYSGLSIAMLFVFYEVFGVVTNLVGGWLGARIGLNKTMNIGLFLQVIALSMLLLPAAYLIVPWVMAAQALSGIAKDLNKMSAKSSIKMLVSSKAQGTLFKWVALLTGSKNALKGLGFFIGGLLLTLVGFQLAILCMVIMLLLVWTLSLIKLKQDLGKSSTRPKFREILSKSRAINILSAARLLLFGARDVWFVIALPLYLASQLGWDHWSVGSFLAIWVIGYGGVQSIAPLLLGKNSIPDAKTITLWALLLCAIPALIAIALTVNWQPELALLGGLMLFGAVFAINSSVHSYLIVSYAKSDGVSMDVGFYYMANALGRLLGTVLSGWLYQSAGLTTCLWVSSTMLILAVLISKRLN
ncbi:MAG: MFS transporter [Rheinheimera sp.]|uniref:organoarsenical effux MFS transporter ArsJ n=1 Tax=Arsukibacterium sp. UBA3155 TaxID=1946058 RepID=UPI000C93F2A8|nr:organoarsenical effux MFS transporter ArsJ [Arsukibacterium sp. UBA3155]MAD75462.1 MFS transporter [Rheinheimera sp.]|tara:strand:- start:25939 stop:27132 length:1194 start_codon:yes stop_codon:yes gene_type:complete